MPVIGHLSATKPRSAGLSGVLKPQSKVHLERHFRSHRWTSGTEKARGGGLFKVDVPQAFEEIAVFNHSKKWFPSKSDFQRRSYIFCAAVDNGKGFLTVQKSHRCNQRRTPPAAQKLRRNRQRATATFFLYFLAVFSGFLSILIPFLTSCAPHPPCVPHLSVAFYVVKSKASPEQLICSLYEQCH